MKNLSMLSLVALMIIFSGVVSAQEATNDPTTIEVIEQVGETIELLSSNLYTGAKSAISDLAKALEVPATHVYEVLVRQQVIKGKIAASAFGIVILTLVGFISVFTFLRFKEDNDDWYIGVIISCILFAVTILAFAAESGDIFTRIYNPEYGAMKEIVNWIK